MATVHFLNVCPGDCTVIQHNSDRVSMIDICSGNETKSTDLAERIVKASTARGNFRMCEDVTNPIDYLASLKIGRLFRFILTHPDMDHMDGIDALIANVGVDNFWHTGVTRAKPKFGLGCPYKEEDWDRYEDLRSSRVAGVTVLKHLADARFPFANQAQGGAAGGDGLYILAPDAALVAASSRGDINDGSYVLLYKSSGFTIVIPGDAHDVTWEYVLKHHRKDVENCSVLIAPHHGRGSDRNYDFLDVMKPQLTLFGCAPSQYLDYGAWNRRDLPKITSNQAGNVVLEIDTGTLDVHVQNDSFARQLGIAYMPKNAQGYSRILRLTSQAVAA